MNCKAVEQHIVSWLKDYASNAHARGFVVGISGGIDSAVTSTLAARTGMRTICVDMPIHQQEAQVQRGIQHIESLVGSYPNVQSNFVELGEVFDQLVTALPDCPEQELKELSLANARARLRMTALYHVAQINGLLVTGTGNKVEDFGVGFFTKYGDGGVDLSPIADLNKTEVFELGHHLGVSQDILDAPPTDGLWGDDRTDEDQLGASYPELEWAMDFDGDASALEGRQKEVFDIYSEFHRRNQHKMVPIPVCKISSEIKGED